MFEVSIKEKVYEYQLWNEKECIWLQVITLSVDELVDLDKAFFQISRRSYNSYIAVKTRKNAKRRVTKKAIISWEWQKLHFFKFWIVWEIG